MRSILEQAVLHHLNGDDERATELFHQFIVARARSIHESMRNGDEPLVEGWDEEAVSEEFMATEDLDLSELEDDGEADLDADLGADDAALDMGDADLEDEEAADDLAADLGDDEEAAVDDGDLADEVEALKAELEALTAEFEDMRAEMGGEDAEDAADTDELVDDDMGGDEVAGEDPAMDMADPEEDEDDAPFQAMGESLTSDLEKVQVSLTTDGKEIAAGGAITQQRKSALPQKKHDARQGGKPVEVRAKQHKGYDREAAPSVQSMKPRRNNVAKAKDALSPVKK